MFLNKENGDAVLPLSTVSVCPCPPPSSILPHCRKQNDADFSKQGLDLVAHVTRLIELVIDYRNVPADDYNKDNRMGCMFNLLVGGGGGVGRGGVGWGAAGRSDGGMCGMKDARMFGVHY